MRLQAFGFALLPLTLAFLAPLDTLRFGPKSGTEVKKSMTVNLEMNVEEIDIVVDGESIPPEALGEVTSQALIVEVTQAVTEKYLGVKDGKLTELIRTYDSMDFSVEMGEETTTEGGGEELIGKSVRFAWNDKTNTYDKEWFECEGEEGLLKGLSEDMDLRKLLPAGSVKADQEWTLEGKDLGALLWPGVTSADELDLSSADLDAEAQEIAQLMFADLGPRFEEALKGMKIGLKYVGTREVDGVEVGEIAIAIDGRMNMDLSEIIQKLAEKAGGEELSGAEVSVSMGMGMKGEGTLLWNSASGHLHSYKLDATMDFDLNANIDVDVQGESHGMSATIKVNGKAGWDLSQVK